MTNAPPEERALGRWARCVVAAVTFWGAAVIPPSVVAVLLAVYVGSACGDASADCSWGFEYLLVVPFALASWVLVAPFAVFLALRAVGDRLAAVTARWSAVWGFAGLVFVALTTDRFGVLSRQLAVALVASPLLATATAERRRSA